MSLSWLLSLEGPSLMARPLSVSEREAKLTDVHEVDNRTLGRPKMGAMEVITGMEI